ncbi:hypothetical protein AQY21_20720 [Paracoccus sp. MKU1]|nr:hypothetical protein AQY21_20720 [Paracoccus sp. MKU1]
MLFKIETQTGVDPVPTAAQDAILVGNPNWTADPQIIERDFVTTDLSNFEHRVGRVVSGFSFEVELRGNGKQHSGLVADASAFAKLIRACGYALGANNGAAAQATSDVIPVRGNTGPAITWTKSGNTTITSPVLYTLEVVTGGASGTAQVICRNNNPEAGGATSAARAITTGQAQQLGDSGISITPTFSGNLVVGDKFQVQVFPRGVIAKPVSEGHSTGTIYMWKDGNLHKGHAGMGSFTIEAQAGDIAKATFNFTTTYVKPIAQAMPANPVYEDLIAPQVELSLLTWGGNRDMIAESWSFDAGNDIQARMDVNAAQGYLGSRIAGREPKGGFTPEVQLESDEPFWADFAEAKSKTFTVRVGTEAGNQIAIFGPRAQTSEQSYTDRNGILAYDKSILFKRGLTGDDETIFCFC